MGGSSLDGARAVVSKSLKQYLDIAYHSLVVQHAPCSEERHHAVVSVFRLPWIRTPVYVLSVVLVSGLPLHWFTFLLTQAGFFHCWMF